MLPAQLFSASKASADEAVTHTIDLRTRDASMGLIEDETGAISERIIIEVPDKSPYTYDPYTGVMTYLNTSGVTKIIKPHPLEGYKLNVWTDFHGEPPAEEEGIIEHNTTYWAYFMSSDPVWGNSQFMFADIGESMGWTEGQILSSTYTLNASKVDPLLPTSQAIELVGNENMSYQTVNGEKAIVYGANTQKDSGFIKVPVIPGYDISEISYRIQAVSSTGGINVACVCSTGPYYDEHQEWWDWKIPDNVEWWITPFNPDYNYVEPDSDFYINAWNVLPNQKLAISGIGVTYTKKLPKCIVSGQVVDKNGSPVKDVIVSSLGENAQTTTDINGNWQLSVIALNDTSFIFTKNGFYESSLFADLEGLSEYSFENPYIIQLAVNTSFEHNSDPRHNAFIVDFWENGVKTGSADFHRHAEKFAEGASITLEEDGVLHYDYTDVNTNKHIEQYIKAVPLESYYFAGWNLTNNQMADQTVEPGQTIILDSELQNYEFSAVYSDTPPVPPTPPQPDNPQAEKINGAQTGDSTALILLVLTVLSAAIVFVVKNRKEEHLF